MVVFVLVSLCSVDSDSRQLTAGFCDREKLANTATILAVSKIFVDYSSKTMARSVFAVFTSSHFLV
jgi:hypothetical protein